jgi:2-succinyl-5-enolpyruvyl-6-hydroxy-3-cyclohexene-1-carboxylate synthase
MTRLRQGDAAGTYAACRVFWQTLKKIGCRRVYLCPGNRNVPLIFAAYDTDGVDCVVHHDERGAAFAALGEALVDDQPVAVCTTSGTAVANTLPALWEARERGVPLLLVSANRPPELQQSGAPQTTNQYPLASDIAHCQLPPPEDATDHTAWLQPLADVPANGPWQIDLGLREPFNPPAELRQQQFPGLPINPLQTATTTASPPQPVPQLPLPPQPKSGNGIIWLGANPPQLPETFFKHCAEKNIPVLVDVASGLRHVCSSTSGTAGTNDTTVLVSSEAWLDHAPAPDWIVLIGVTPVPTPAQRWLQQTQAPLWQITRVPLVENYHQDGAHNWCVQAAKPEDLRIWFEQLPAGTPAWLHTWQSREQQSLEQLTTHHLPWGEISAARRLANRDAAWWLVANSMSLRHASIFLQQPAGPVYVNRGVNGIDGLVATAVGIAQRRQEPGLCWLGDLALLHDASSLSLLAHTQAPVTIVCMANNGGAIFELLPVAKAANFTELIQAPAPTQLATLAQAHGLDVEVITEPKQLETWCQQPLSNGPKVVIIEPPSRDSATARGLATDWRDLMRSIAEAVGD